MLITRQSQDRFGPISEHDKPSSLSTKPYSNRTFVDEGACEDTDDEQATQFGNIESSSNTIVEQTDVEAEGFFSDAFDGQMLLPRQPDAAKLHKSNQSSTNIIPPSSPTSFKVSPSEASEEANDTAPSSVDDDEEEQDHLHRSFISQAISGSANSLLGQGHHELNNRTAISPLMTNKSSHITPTVKTGEASSQSITSSNSGAQRSFFTSAESRPSINQRRHTTSAIHRNSTHSINGSKLMNHNNTNTNNTNTNNTNNHNNSKNLSTLYSKRKSLDHNAFSDRSNLTNSIKRQSTASAAQIGRSRTSLDMGTRQDSTNQEITRMRNSIVERRKMMKKRKEFLDDERVLVGNKISEGHENFVMAYNMLTGIRVAVSRCSGVMKKLTDEDFKATKKLSFNVDGSELTPSSKYDFKFKDYCPEVFRELRSIFGLDPADYLVSITGKYILSELGSPGKSGSFFYFSRDYRFIIKTIHHSEHKQLLKILKDYYSHVKANPNTLISQIYGLHRVKMPLTSGSRMVHFLVMNNLFPPHRDIHIKYDLKGSTWGRETKLASNEEEELSKVTLKDLNWLERKDFIKFGPAKKNSFLRQLESDVKFLEKINVMDYSLLLGIHDVKKGNSQDTGQKLTIFDPKSTNKSDLLNTNPRDLDRNSDLPSNVFPGRSQLVFYGHDGGIRSTNEDDSPTAYIYYLGIIDCLTNYSVKKKLETFWRSLSHKRETISAVPAREYGERFLKFIKAGVTTEKRKQD